MNSVISGHIATIQTVQDEKINLDKIVAEKTHEVDQLQSEVTSSKQSLQVCFLVIKLGWNSNLRLIQSPFCAPLGVTYLTLR